MKKKWIVLILFIMMFQIVCFAEDTKTIANFKFVKTAFQQNEPIEIINESRAAIGHKIIRNEWMVLINGKKKTSASIQTLLSDATPGTYTVYLRVKDDAGTWSAYTSRQVKIIPNVPMKLTKFVSLKSSYGIGEKLTLNYTYDNPNDLDIRGQRWRYRNISTNGSYISGKPRYFKKAGTYEITLQLQDEWGNWSNKLSCKVVVSNKVIKRDGYYLFEKGIPGDLIEGYVDQDYNYYDEADIIATEDVAGTLIMSNSPETVKRSGILYRDTVSGSGRLVVHHINTSSVAKKLLVMVSNPGDSVVTLTINNASIKGPGKHILQLGQEAVLQYLKNNTSKTYTLKPGEQICVYSSAYEGSWDYNEVVTGTLDFISTDKLTWNIASLDFKTPANKVSSLSVLARDTHDRGTFNVIERRYTVDLAGVTELKKFVVGKTKNEWLQGIDALTGETVYNRGNYGLPIKINVKNSEDIGVVINARGGAYLGAVKWNGQKILKVPGEQILQTQDVAALVGTIKKNTQGEILYMLPNGSSAPVLFGFVPKSVWK